MSNAIRVIVESQGFENYNTQDFSLNVAAFKFKIGCTYEVIVNDFEKINLTNVIRAMYAYISRLYDNDNAWQEYPTSHLTLPIGELMPMEKQYKEYGDKFTVYRLTYENGIITKQEKVYTT